MADDAARDEFLTEASETVDNQYSPDKYYTASRNKKGFGTTIRINVPPEVLSMVSQLVQSKVIPEYTTGEAFFRDAIVHRIKYLGDIIRDDRVGLTETGKLLLAADSAARFLAQRESVEKTLKEYDESLRLAEGMDRIRIIKRLKENIRDVDDDTFKSRGQRIVDQYER